MLLLEAFIAPISTRAPGRLAQQQADARPASYPAWIASLMLRRAVHARSTFAEMSYSMEARQSARARQLLSR
jgi:hypothetical protein